jgi:hypothetical protein
MIFIPSLVFPKRQAGGILWSPLHAGLMWFTLAFFTLGFSGWFVWVAGRDEASSGLSYWTAAMLCLPVGVLGVFCAAGSLVCFLDAMSGGHGSAE